MSNEILVAMVGLAGSLAGSVIGVVGSAKVITYRVQQLERCMETQAGNVAAMDDRVDKIESRQGVMEFKIETANQRIEKLENAMK